MFVLRWLENGNTTSCHSLQLLKKFLFLPFVSLTVQERVASVRGSQTDIADEKASSVIEQCQSTLVNAEKLFDQALTPSTCAACLNSELESDSREFLADKVNRADTYIVVETLLSQLMVKPSSNVTFMETSIAKRNMY